MEHVADGASSVGNTNASEESTDRPYSNQGFYVWTQGGGDLQQGKDGKAHQVEFPPPKGFREWSQDERTDA